MKRLFLILLFCSICIISSAQKIHLNLFAGASNYQGDIQAKTFNTKQTKLAAGVGFSYELTDKIFLRTGFTFARVTADDKFNSKNYLRNLNFTSPITEGHLGLEYYFFNLHEHFASPYIFGAIAIYHFNPYTKDTSGVKYFLKPLTTEGEGFYENRKPYSLTQLAIPFGGGIKVALSENIHVGAEIGLRKLFTDYLDDVSTSYVDENLLFTNSGAKAVELAYRGDELKNAPASYPATGSKRGSEKYKDWYYFTGLTLSFRIGGSEANSSWKGSRHRSQTGCPARVL